MNLRMDNAAVSRFPSVVARRVQQDTSRTFMRLLLNILLLTVAVDSYSQVSSLVEVRLVLGDAQTPDGPHSISVGWYDSPVGGSSFSDETLNIVLQNGIVMVVLGNTSPLPTQLIERGAAFLGISVDGMPERVPRIQLAPNAYARAAATAEVARALSPDVTGVVTSINELAGAVKIIADDGVRITRDGTILRIGATPSTLEWGSIYGDGTAFTFAVTPQMPLRNTDDVTFHVAAGTTNISAQVSVDVVTNTVSFVTSAALLKSESIEWKIKR